MATKYLENRGLLTAEQAKMILSPYLEDLKGDFQSSWAWVQDILDQDPERRVSLDLSTQAAMVFNRFVTLTTRRFYGHQSVIVKRSGRLMKIFFVGGLVLRFKKFDNKLRSHNVKTNQQAMIYYQMTLNGIDAATHVTFGYRTDATGRNVAGVYITCPLGWSQNKWAIPVQESDSDGLAFAPIAPVGPENDDHGFILEPNNLEKKKSEGQ